MPRHAVLGLADARTVQCRSPHTPMAAKHDLTTSDLAIRARLDATAFNMSMRAFLHRPRRHFAVDDLGTLHNGARRAA